MKATIQGAAQTMRYIKDAGDIVSEDIAEMARRLNHPKGRKGYRARDLHSRIGIHGYPAETITISLGSATNSNNIVVLHDIRAVRISVTYDGDIVVRIPGSDIDNLPESIKHAIEGKTIGEIIDLTNTSMMDMSKSVIKSYYTQNGDRAYTSFYLNGCVSRYDAEVFSKMIRPDKG